MKSASIVIRQVVALRVGQRTILNDMPATPAEHGIVGGF